jgi:hypothetical protein
MIIVWLIIVVGVLLWLSWVSIGLQWEDIDLTDRIENDSCEYRPFPCSSSILLPSGEVGYKTTPPTEGLD